MNEPKSHQQRKDDFGFHLSTLLRKHNMKNSELAKRVSVSSSAVSYYISGKKLPSFHVACKIAITLKSNLKEMGWM